MKIIVEVTQPELDEMELTAGELEDLIPTYLDEGAYSNSFEFEGYDVQVNLIAVAKG